MQNNKQYDWHLANSAELRRLGNDWQVCPQCGRKEFKPYVNLAGEPLARECGRCNREINCQYHLPPKEYLSEHPVQVKKVERVQVAPPKKPIFMPIGWVAAKRKDNDKNVLLKYLRNLPWNDAQRARLEVAILSYGIGTDKLGRTIFWQIDENVKVRSGKQMAYKSDGHRDKNKHPMWVHNAVKTVYPENEYEYVGCLFGLHLAATFKNAEICLVESEKTALICSAFWPMEEKVWIATGGLRNVNVARLFYLLKNKRKIIAYPDHDGYKMWADKMKEVSDDIRVSDFVEKYYKEGVDAKTADIADILVRILQQTPNPNQITAEQLYNALINENTYFKEFTECLELTLTNPKEIIKSSQLK